MSDVTMIGLGAMGSALARAFVGAGHAVTVWNRSAGRMAPLTALGAKGAASLPDAAQASPLIVVCIDNYQATRDLLGEEAVAAALSGKTLVQLSTGTPKEAREMAAWLSDRGVTYLDGAIMPYPQDIGAEDAQILFSGPQAAYEASKPLLDCLGGDLRYLGENVSAAAVLDMALLTHQLCGYLGVLHGARICEAEKVPVATLASLLPQDDPVAKLATRIHLAAYDKPGATLQVWNAALLRIVDQGREAGINTEIPDLIASLFKRAIAAGYDQQDVGSTIQILRRDETA